MDKGQTNNPNGRPKGTPNKVTSSVRNFLMEVLNGNRDQFLNDLQTLKPVERIDVILKLLPYILPKVENAGDVEGAAFTRDDIKDDSGWDLEFKKNKLKLWYEP